MPLSQGTAGAVHEGERLTWAKVGDRNNFALLVDTGWQAHVYGDVSDDVAGWCERQSIALHRFAWDPAYGAAGLARDALYLIRPDTYVALADPNPTAAALQRYVDARGLIPCGRPGTAQRAASDAVASPA